MCGHLIVGTFRGGRSQWVRNLAARPTARYWLGGKRRTARVSVLQEGERYEMPDSLPLGVQAVVRALEPYTRIGWVFALLSPATAR